VVGILMPELALTKRENVEHAEKLAKMLEVNTLKVPINRFLIEYSNLPWNSDENAGFKLANMNVKARVRANILYHFANSYKCLVFGTSNLSETLLGYGTKYGDLAADLEVIGALYKTQVRELARYLGLPEEIILKAPSAELTENQTDENELGADYEILDKILENLDKGEAGLIDLGFDPGLVRDVMHRVKVNKHKSEMPKIINS
jgi:NAD+ synthase